MTFYLNTERALINYRQLVSSKYFIDKSLMLEQLNERIGTPDKYVCITRPRRFGKSSAADMLGAYYGKAVDSKAVFGQLKISKQADYEAYRNQYNVIHISFNRIPDQNKTYEAYIGFIQQTLKDDIKHLYPDVAFKDYLSVSDQLFATGDQFIFIFDEWDYIFNNNLFVQNQDDFLEFLRNLLKDQPYVALAYMTGVLPIKKYSSGSALNMFDEFTMLNDRQFGAYFGFTENEVKCLCEKNACLRFEELEIWYNGYITATGTKIYNPRSVVKALQNNHCGSYWTNTGAMDEVAEYLKYNTLEIREDVIEMVAGESIDLTIREEFRAGQATPRTKKEIYSAMIVLGFLAYYDGYLKIPNKELMHEFEKALMDEAFGEVSQIIEQSRKMLKATVNQNTEVVERMLHAIHNSEIPILQYNDENSLSCVLTLAYLSARDTYRIEREEKTGKGYADFMFYPRRKNDPAFVVELKKDERPEVALEQIKAKEYIEKLRKASVSDQILAVAICYDSKSKTHHCKIEKVKALREESLKA